MIYEVRPTINESIMELEEMIECVDIENDLATYMRQYYFNEENDNFIVKMKAPGDGRRKEKNREGTDIDMSYMKKLSTETITNAITTKASVAAKIKQTLHDRFDDCYDEKIIESTKWFSPKNWTNEKIYAMDDIDALYEHFSISLDCAGYDNENAKKEWIRVRRYIVSHFSKNDKATDVWQKILTSKREEFSNICLLVELIICISGSNSSVERSFSLLTNMLSDRRLSTSHDTMNMLLKLKINNAMWNDVERNEIIDRGLDIYLSKRRMVQIEHDEEPATKRSKLIDVDNDAYGLDDCEWIDIMESDSDINSDSD